MKWIMFTLCAVLGACREGSGSPVRSAFLYTAARSSVVADSGLGKTTINSSAPGHHDAGVGDATPSDSGAPALEASPVRRVSWPWPREKPPAVATDWCIDKVNALDQSACYVLPDEPTRTLLIYLPGIVPPEKDSPQKSNVETVVANAARRAGVAALIPRGKQGLAPPGHNRWWGWPTTDASYRQHAAAMVSTFAEQRKKLEDIAGVSFNRVYLAGSSSGAYFAARLAMRGGIDAHGFGAISGGAATDVTGLDKLEPKPFYIGYGKADGPVRGTVAALADVLRRAKWPVRTAEHPVDHGAHEIYLDEAIAFWREHDR